MFKQLIIIKSIIIFIDINVFPLLSVTLFVFNFVIITFLIVIIFSVSILLLQITFCVVLRQFNQPLF